MKDAIINQVKKIIIRTLEKFAKDIGCDKEKVFLYITTKNETDNPILVILDNNGNAYKKIGYDEVNNCLSGFESWAYSLAGFSVEKDMPEWLRKFMIKSARDNGKPINELSYTLMIHNDDIKAFMYIDRQYKPVTIDYILETK